MGLNRIFLVGLVWFVQACAPTVYNVAEPVASTYTYDLKDADQNKEIALVDKRSKRNYNFGFGTLPAELTLNKVPLVPVDFLKTHIKKELNSRGISVASTSGSDGTKIDILDFRMENQRTNGFTPFNTFTTLAADIHQNGKKVRVTSYIHRGKVPVWSFDEIITPTFSEPLSIIVKEVSAKINSTLYGQRISDKKVQIISDKILNTKATGQTYLDVYELGFGNNLKAIDTLVDLSKNENFYIRVAAISSIGMLKDPRQFDYLKSIFYTSKPWQDRAASIKAIGDMGTEQSLEFLQQAYENLPDTGKENQWIKNVIDLYLM